MDIANFEKISLQDYPGKISSICFMNGCQLRCPYCHNPNLVLPELFDHGTSDMKFKLMEYLRKRKNMIEGVVLSGGEPLMQEDLMDLIYPIKELGLKVKLDTNGMLPNRLNLLIDKGLLDYIALDYKGSADNLNESVGLESFNKDNILYDNWSKSLDMVHSSSIDYELRTTVVKEIHSIDHLSTMAKELDLLLSSPVSKWFLQTFEESSDILNLFTKAKTSLSAYSKEEMMEIKNKLENIIPGISLRNTL